MPSASYTPIALTTATDLLSLRNNTQVAINRLVNQLNQHDHVLAQDTDAKNYTIRNLSPPAQPRDAATKQYVDDSLVNFNKDLQNQINRRTRPYLGAGGGGTSTATSTFTYAGTYVQSTPGSTFTPDLSSQKDTQELTLTSATCTIKNPTGGSSDFKWDLILLQDATGGRRVVFDTNYKGLTNATGNIDIDTKANSYTVYRFVVRPDGKSMMLSPALTGRTY